MWWKREVGITDVQPTDLQQLRDATMSLRTKRSEDWFQYRGGSKAVLKAKGGPTGYWQGVPNEVAGE